MRLVIGGVALVAALAGCADATRSIGRVSDEFRIEPGIVNTKPSPQAMGIFVDGGTGRVHALLRNKSLISAIDELAYKAGFNYIVLADLSAVRISIGDKAGKQVWRENEQAMLDALLDAANQQLAENEPKIRYRWVSNGPMLYRSMGPDDQAGIESGMSFKKIFFKNIMADEALIALTELFEPEIEMKRDLEFRDNRPSLEKIAKDTKEDERLAKNVAIPEKKAAIVAYRPQNALLVRGGNLATYQRLAEILPSLDAEFQAVLVETQVFEYDDSIARKIGMSLDYSKGVLSSDPSKAKFQLKTNFGETISNVVPQFFLNLSDVERKATLLSALALYDREGLVRIMAEPRLTLKSGEQADVKLTTKRYYMTSSVNAAGDIKDLETGITFKVQPTVLGDGKILLRLDIQQSEFIPSNDPNAISATNDNRIKTSIIARDGELVSLGGILSKREAKLGSGLPGLRKLPVVGNIFGYDASDSSVTRVEFMIRPRVKLAEDRNNTILAGLRNTNCRISRYMDNKSSVDCHEPTSDLVEDLDATAQQQSGQNP